MEPETSGTSADLCHAALCSVCVCSLSLCGPVSAKANSICAFHACLGLHMAGFKLQNVPFPSSLQHFHVLFCLTTMLMVKEVRNTPFSRQEYVYIKTLKLNSIFCNI